MEFSGATGIWFLPYVYLFESLYMIVLRFSLNILIQSTVCSFALDVLGCRESFIFNFEGKTIFRKRILKEN